MDVAIASALPAARPRAVALTQWRRAAHGALHGALAFVCAAGAFAGSLVGREVHRGVLLVEQRDAASVEWRLWLLTIAVVGIIGAVDRRRTTSLGTSAALVVGSIATLVAAFGTMMQAVVEVMGMAGLGPWAAWWFSDVPPTYVSLWPQDVVAIAVLACLAAGPVAFLVHVLLFWREDRRLRTSAA